MQVEGIERDQPIVEEDIDCEDVLIAWLNHVLGLIRTLAQELLDGYVEEMEEIKAEAYAEACLPGEDASPAEAQAIEEDAELASEAKHLQTVVDLPHVEALEELEEVDHLLALADFLWEKGEGLSPVILSALGQKL